MRSTMEQPLGTSPSVSSDLPSAITLCSTSVYSSSTCFFVTPYDDAHVNLSSRDDESGSFTTSSGFSSTGDPIFYYDDDIMEVVTTPEFIYPPLHRTHAFEPHTLVAIKMTPNVWVRGHPYLRDQEKKFSTTLLIYLVMSNLVPLF